MEEKGRGKEIESVWGDEGRGVRRGVGDGDGIGGILGVCGKVEVK